MAKRLRIAVNGAGQRVRQRQPLRKRGLGRWRERLIFFPAHGQLRRHHAEPHAHRADQRGRRAAAGRGRIAFERIDKRLNRQLRQFLIHIPFLSTTQVPSFHTRQTRLVP